jgi:hypothetical protein
MKALILPATRSTPGVRFDPALGVFELTGTSVPENASEFYQPVVEWLANNFPDLKGEHVMHFHLSYFNSTSLKAIYQLLKKAKEACLMGQGTLRICWHGDADDDLLVETASMLSELLDMPMDIVPDVDEGAQAAG